MKFGIDLGHGCKCDGGAVGRIAEEKIINEVGNLVISKLKTLGHTVVELRPETAISTSNSLQQRYSKADYYNVDMCISLHANAGGGNGTEVFTYNAKEVSQARAVLNNLVSLGFKNRGLKDGSNLAMVKRPKATSMLIEICFIDSTDVDMYNSIGPEKISNAIVSGLTGTKVSTGKEKKYYVVTNYLPNAYANYDGVDINYVLQYFKDVKCYMRGNSKGIWIETEYLAKEKAESLKNLLGAWFYAIKE